jgi:ribosomal protein S27E
MTMSDTDDTSAPAAPAATTNPAAQARFLASARRKSMTPDPGAGPIVLCPRCRAEMRWGDLDKHMVMKQGDSAYRHCSNRDCSSIFSLQEGEDARDLHGGVVAEPEPDAPDDGTRPEPGPGPEREPYETPSLAEINIGAADALIAHHAKELALKLIRVADVVVDEIAKANSGGETRGLLDAIKYSLELAGQADMLGDKAVLRAPIIKTADPHVGPFDRAKCRHCNHAWTLEAPKQSVECPGCGKALETEDARRYYFDGV